LGEEFGVASGKKSGLGEASESAETRKLLRLILRTQIVLVALVTLALGCFAVPAQLTARSYDSAPRCADGVQDSDCVALVQATVSSIGQSSTGKSTAYRLELTGIGSGETQFIPVSPGAGIDGLVGQVTPGDMVTAVIWHGDLAQVESGGYVAVDSGSPDVTARNWLGGFAIPLSCLLGLLIMYGGIHRKSGRVKALVMTTGALTMVNGPVFLVLQDKLTARPSPLLALASFGGVVVAAAGLWALSSWATRRKNRKVLESLVPKGAMSDSASH
jgi:hypothetical protein